MAPIPLGASPSPPRLGDTFEAVGYGVRGPGLARDVRVRGALRLYAVDGAPLPSYFGTLARFLDAAEDHFGMPLGEFLVEDLTVRYGRKLLTDYEVYLFGAGAQTCHGDSGGPLLRATPEGRARRRCRRACRPPWNPSACAAQRDGRLRPRRPRGPRPRSRRSKVNSPI